MGRWGDAPWDNDAAADWFNAVFRTTHFAEQIAIGLNANIEDAPEIVRAAAHAVFVLGHVYVWPVERLSDDLRLAADRLQLLLDRGWQPATPLRRELRAIQARLEPRKKTKGHKHKEVEQDSIPTTNSTNLWLGKFDVRVAWIRDLATVEQRRDASALRWGILPPTVTLLKTADSKRLLAGTDNHLQLIDMADGETLHDFVELGAKYSGIPDEPLIAHAGNLVTLDGKHIRVRKLSGEVIFAIEEPARVAKRAISGDSRWLILLTWSGALYVYDVVRGEKRFEFKHEAPKNPQDADCAVSLEGRRAISSFAGSVCFWDLQSGSEIRRHRNKFAGVRLTASGKSAITRTGTGSVLWDVESGEKIREIAGVDTSSLGNYLISPDCRYVCEVAPFKGHNQRGEVISVRAWTDQDAPYTGTGRIDFAWFGADHLVCWRNLIAPSRIATCEVRLWALDPLRLVGTAEVAPLLLPIENESEPLHRGVQFFRIAADVDQKMIFAGDGNAHVYAFLVE